MDQDSGSSVSTHTKADSAELSSPAYSPDSSSNSSCLLLLTIYFSLNQSTFSNYDVDNPNSTMTPIRLQLLQGFIPSIKIQVSLSRSIRPSRKLLSLDFVYMIVRVAAYTGDF